jgi:branched-chain amino acid transport system substrate-binding protein
MNDSTTRRDLLKYATLIAGGAIAGPGLLAACSSSGAGSGSDTFKIGAVLELSGPDSSGGQLAQRGYQFWVDTVRCSPKTARVSPQSEPMPPHD